MASSLIQKIKSGGSYLNLSPKMKQNKKYKVYTTKGEFHHCYNSRLEGSLGWAIDCAKTINGFVMEMNEDGKEIEIFNNSALKNVPVN